MYCICIFFWGGGGFSFFKSILAIGPQNVCIKIPLLLPVVAAFILLMRNNVFDHFEANYVPNTWHILRSQRHERVHLVLMFTFTAR